MQNSDEGLQGLYWTLVLAFIAIIFVVDLALPSGITVSPFYFAPVYASIFVIESRRAPLILYITCCSLILVAMWFSDWPEQHWMAVLNAGIAISLVSIGSVVSYRDRFVILERKANEVLLKKKAQEMRQMIAKLKRSNQDLDDFAYIASHDLKEPMRGLANNAKFLLEDYGDKIDAAGVTRLHRLCFLCERMDHLVNDLLYFSRIGRQDLAVQETNLETLVHEVRSMMDDPHLEIKIATPLPSVYCDRTRITEVYRNLIVNAAKYNDSIPKIVELGLLSEQMSPHGLQKAVYYVRDNGIGIEAQFYEEIFRIFKRLNEEDDTKKGTGAGLTFVRKIIERHKGKIWVASTPGKGSTFFFTLGANGQNEAISEL